MILMNEVIKLGGEVKDRIGTIAIATAMEDIIVTHAFAAAACHAAYSYAAATLGEMTREVTLVEHHGAIVGEVQEEFTGRGERVIVEDYASTANLRGGHAPPQLYTPVLFVFLTKIRK